MLFDAAARNFAPMTSFSRRTFVGLSLASAGLQVLPAARAQGRIGQPVRVGVLGCGKQGRHHLEQLLKMPQAQVVAICDVDRQRLADASSAAPGAATQTDLRRVLDDTTIDAVTIATPDHWHAPAALLAMEAGKHVYVEKPCSHKVFESQKLVASVARHQRVFAHGTQARSSEGFAQVMAQLRAGMIGRILSARCWNWQRRDDIGRHQPSTPPNHLDYDLWVGPATWLPYQSNRCHYHWHWWYNFGCGDMGNDGAHEIDYALWGLGVDQHPSAVSALGGKYFFEDDQEFPDTQQVTFEFTDPQGREPRMLVYEQRLWSTSYPYNVDSGAEFFGTEGKLFISKRGKVEWRDARNQVQRLVPAPTVRASVAENLRNWLECIPSGQRPEASIEVAHRVATAIHLGNIATRLQRTLRFDPQQEHVIDDVEAQGLLRRQYRDGGHWAAPAT